MGFFVDTYQLLGENKSTKAKSKWHSHRLLAREFIKRQFSTWSLKLEDSLQTREQITVEGNI